MDATWTREDLDLLASLVQDLLSRPHLSAADLPLMRWALAEMQAYLELVYRAEGQREELMQALTEEVETLRALVEGESEPWDTDDDAW